MTKATDSEDAWIKEQERKAAQEKADAALAAETRELRAQQMRAICKQVNCEPQFCEQTFEDVVIDRCLTCGGVWLDPGELEKVTADDASSGGFLSFLRKR